MAITPEILFCFNSLTTKFIEIIIIFLSSFAAILTIIGLAVIPWGYTSRVMEVLYIISLILFIYLLGIPIFILFICKKKINENIMKIYIVNSCIAIFASIFSILLCIIIAIGAIRDLNNNHKTEKIESKGQNSVKEITNKEKDLVSKGELTYAVLSIIVNLILSIILLLLWITENYRLKNKIESSYNDYMNFKKNPASASVSIENSKENECNVVGHDKYGFPIYIKKLEDKLQYKQSKSEFNYRSFNKCLGDNKYDTETNNILRYSYKENFNQNYMGKQDYKSVDVILKLKEEKKERYIEKYPEGGVNPYYSNFENKTALNISSINNSINPGY